MVVGSWSRLVADQSNSSRLLLISMLLAGRLNSCLYQSVSHMLFRSVEQVTACMRVLKRGSVRLANEKDFPYYPTRYFRRQVANCLVNNRQRVLLHKESYLRQTYSLPDEDAQFPTPFSYK